MKASEVKIDFLQRITVILNAFKISPCPAPFLPKKESLSLPPNVKRKQG